MENESKAFNFKPNLYPICIIDRLINHVLSIIHIVITDYDSAFMNICL